MNVWEQMRKQLEDLAAADLLRTPVVVESPVGPRITINGRSLVCLCSNDYLSLANDPAVKAAAAGAIERWGVGAGASRLISGTTQVHVDLERALAEFKGTEAAIVTSTGWMANHVAVHALAGRGDLILCDKLNHASILDAAISSGARVRTFPHKDTAAAAKLLDARRSGYRRCLIVTDSLFSMDGDLAPLGELVKLKEQYDAQLLIDEAHATGVLGENGRGAAEMLGVEEHIDAAVGTLSKAIGALGGFVAGPTALIETIRNRGRAFIYTTAPPPAVLTAALKALEIIRTAPERRERLLELTDRLRRQLTAAGLDTRDSNAQIIPIVIGSAPRTLCVGGRLMEEGFFIPAIRPPAVPKGTSRLRISLCSNHAAADLNRLVGVLTDIIDEVSPRRNAHDRQ